MKEYKLVTFTDNSAPCGNCIFLDRPTLECKFPKDQERECEFKPGTNKGWNTKEYIKV